MVFCYSNPSWLRQVFSNYTEDYSQDISDNTLGTALTRKKKEVGRGKQDEKSIEYNVLISKVLKEALKLQPVWAWAASFISWRFPSPLRRTTYTLTLPKFMVTLLLSPLHTHTPTHPVTWSARDYDQIKSLPWDTQCKPRDSVSPTRKLGDHDLWIRKAEKICLQIKKNQTDVKGGSEGRWRESVNGSSPWL